MRTLACAFALVVLGCAVARAEDDPPPNPALTVNPVAIDDLTLDQLTTCNGQEQWEANLVLPEDDKAAIATAVGVRRSGKTLQVGKARFRGIRVHQETGAGIGYAYVGRYRAVPLMLLADWGFESDGFIVVDPATGEHADTAALPLPAPGGHVLVGATRSANYDGPAIELYDWRDGHLTATRIETPYPCGLRWASEDVLEFQASIDPQGKPPLHTTLATVRRENGAWVYHGPPP